MGRIIAIDYGLKRCGLAWTDSFQMIATPIGYCLEIELINKLSSLCKSENISEIVIGYPTQLDGKDTDCTQAVLTFKSKISNLLPDISFHLLDERLTSKMAMNALHIGGATKSQKKNKGLLDSISATILLQNYLDIKQTKQKNNDSTHCNI